METVKISAMEIDARVITAFTGSPFIDENVDLHFQYLPYAKDDTEECPPMICMAATMNKHHQIKPCYPEQYNMIHVEFLTEVMKQEIKDLYVEHCLDGFIDKEQAEYYIHWIPEQEVDETCMKWLTHVNEEVLVIDLMLQGYE